MNVRTLPAAVDAAVARLIPSAEITFHPHSYADPDGRLFWWNGQLHRAISREKAPFFKELFQNGTLRPLMDRGLIIASEPSDWLLDGYGLVLRHACVRFVSYPHEWCAAMFKDAALAYLDLVTELVRYGLKLKDTHPWNVLFECGRPIYVDVTSIRPLMPGAPYLDEAKFTRYYIYPLLLMSRGHERIARHLLPDYEGIGEAEVAPFTDGELPRRNLHAMIGRAPRALVRRIPEGFRDVLLEGFRSVRARLSTSFSTDFGQRRSLDTLRQTVEKIPLPAYQTNPPGKRQSGVPAPSAREESETGREWLGAMIAELRPRSIANIGGELACSLELLARLGIPTVCLNKDSARVTPLFQAARDHHLPILPLVMDFTDPTPSRGLCSHVSIAATERLKCDLVIALGLLSFLTDERHLLFDHIVEGLFQFSNRWLLVDFNLPSRSVSQSASSRIGYTSAAFTAALATRFHTIKCVQTSQDRQIFLCER
jgi:hypothetical protein